MEQKPGNLEGLSEASAKEPNKEADATSKSKDPAPAGDVPDPDEDDLDDLDDMLDEFSPSKPEPKAPSGPGRPVAAATAPAVEDLESGLSDEEFAKQLQAGMADLLGELKTSPEMPQQLANMLKEIEGAAALGEAAGLAAPAAGSTEGAASAARPSSTGAAEESFQETIKKTMERMRASGDQATAAAASSDNSDDMIAEMVKAMQASGLDGEGSEEDFSKMLLGMMEQLTNKEILYEPMKDLHIKFPEWMRKNEGKVPEADMKRYKEQQVYVKAIVERFEAKGYSDENVADRDYIVDKMQKMQEAGSPPPDLVGEMSAAQEAFGAPEEGCPQQ